MRQHTLFILYSSIIIAVAVVFYALGRLQASAPQLVAIAPFPTATPLLVSQEASSGAVLAISPSPEASLAAQQKVKDTILTALNNKTYGEIQQYMADQVFLHIEATDCCGQLTAEETVNNLNYLNNATMPWDFSQTNPVITQILSGDHENYTNKSLIGISENGFIISFTFDSDNQIVTIDAAADYKLLFPVEDVPSGTTVVQE